MCFLGYNLQNSGTVFEAEKGYFEWIKYLLLFLFFNAKHSELICVKCII